MALQPWPLKLLVDYALGDAVLSDSVQALLTNHEGGVPAATLVAAAALASLALFALNSALDAGVTWAWTATGQRMVYDLAGDLFHRLQRLSLLYHRDRPVGDALNRLTGDSWCIYTAVDGLLISPWRRVLTLAGVGVVAWRLDPDLTLLAFGVAPVLGAAGLYFGRRLKRQSRSLREAQSRLMSFTHQTLSSLPLPQIFGAERRNRRQFESLSEEFVGQSQRNVVLQQGFSLASGLVTTAGTAVVLFVGALRVLEGALTLGSLLVFLAYLKTMEGTWQGLLSTYGSLKATEASVDRVFEVLDAGEAVRERPGARALAAPARGHLRLEGVTFGYRPGEPVLRGVDLELRPGETLALVGPTGAGKSTLAALVPRLVDPWEGRVLLDGDDVRGIRLSSLRAQVALVPQEPALLPLSVAENVAYGRPGASRAEVEAAVEAAYASEFVRALPGGYDAVLGERGATLSGGQRQRLAVARALLKDAPVLVLDEPTSALDAEAEAAVMAALDRLMGGRTVLVIAHRLTTALRADRVAVLEGGRVVEEGPPGALLGRGGRFAALCRSQFEPAAAWERAAGRSGLTETADAATAGAAA